MAISFVGSRGGHGGATDSILAFSFLLDETGANPTLSQGDLVVVSTAYRTPTATGVWDKTPAGYTDAFANVTQSGSGNQIISFKTCYKFMGATPDTGVTIAASDAAGDTASAIHVFRGVDATTPLDVTPTTAVGTGSNNPDSPAITPSTSGAWIYAAGGIAGGSTAMTAPAGMASAANDFAQNNNTQAVAGADFYSGWSSGAYDPAAFGGGTPASTGAWAAATLALRPASTGGATTYNDTISESVTSADSLATAAIFGATFSESVTAADGTTGGLLLAATISEAVTPAQAAAVTTTFNPALSEGVAAADAYSSTGIFLSLLSESVVTADGYTNTLNGQAQSIWTKEAPPPGTWTIEPTPPKNWI